MLLCYILPPNVYPVENDSLLSVNTLEDKEAEEHDLNILFLDSICLLTLFLLGISPSSKSDSESLSESLLL